MGGGGRYEKRGVGGWWMGGTAYTYALVIRRQHLVAYTQKNKE